jgi:hypothetical protein
LIQINFDISSAVPAFRVFGTRLKPPLLFFTLSSDQKLTPTLWACFICKSLLGKEIIDVYSSPKPPTLGSTRPIPVLQNRGRRRTSDDVRDLHVGEVEGEGDTANYEAGGSEKQSVKIFAETTKRMVVDFAFGSCKYVSPVAAEYFEIGDAWWKNYRTNFEVIENTLPSRWF